MKSKQVQKREYYQSFDDMELVFQILAELLFKKPENNSFFAQEDDWKYAIDFDFDPDNNQIILTVEEFGITYRCCDMWEIYNAFMQIADIIANDNWESEVYRELETLCADAIDEIFEIKNNPEYL